MLSLMYHVHKNCKFWTSKDIIQILHSGNILYNVIGKSTTLLVSELPQHIKLYNSIYKVQEKPSIIGHIFEGNEQFKLLSFDQVEECIISNKKCILIIRNSSISVQDVENKYYTFDPHQRNSYGFPDSNGSAIVLKFNTFHSLYLYICQLSNKLNAFNYELIPIEITKYTQVAIDTPEKKQKFIQQQMKTVINNTKQQTDSNYKLKIVETNTNNSINQNFIIQDELNEKNSNSLKRKIQQNTCYENTNKKFKFQEEITTKNTIDRENVTRDTTDITIQNKNNKIFKIDTTAEIKNNTNNYEIKYQKIRTIDNLKRKQTEHEVHNKEKETKKKKYEGNKETCTKYLQLKIKDIIEEIHKKNNSNKILKALQDTKECMKYRHNLKTCLVKIKSISKEYIKKIKKFRNHKVIQNY